MSFFRAFSLKFVQIFLVDSQMIKTVLDLQQSILHFFFSEQTSAVVQQQTSNHYHDKETNDHGRHCHFRKVQTSLPGDSRSTFWIRIYYHNESFYHCRRIHDSKYHIPYYTKIVRKVSCDRCP